MPKGKGTRAKGLRGLGKGFRAKTRKAGARADESTEEAPSGADSSREEVVAPKRRRPPTRSQPAAEEEEDDEVEQIEPAVKRPVRVTRSRAARAGAAAASYAAPAPAPTPAPAASTRRPGPSLRAGASVPYPLGTRPELSAGPHDVVDGLRAVMRREVDAINEHYGEKSEVATLMRSCADGFLEYVASRQEELRRRQQEVHAEMLGAKPNPKNAELRDELQRVEERLEKLRPRVHAWEELDKEATEEQSRLAAQREKGEEKGEEEEEEDPLLEPAYKMVLAACPRSVQEALASGEEEGAVVRGVWVPKLERAQAKAAEVRAKAQTVRALCERLDAARRDAVEAYHGQAFPELGRGRSVGAQGRAAAATPRGLLRAVARAGVNTQSVR